MVYHLQPRIDARKSLYGKALVHEIRLDAKQTVLFTLQSYNTEILRFEKDLKLTHRDPMPSTFTILSEYRSQTTNRHIKEFIYYVLDMSGGAEDPQLKELYKWARDGAKGDVFTLTESE